MRISPNNAAAARYLGCSRQAVSKARLAGSFPPPAADGWDSSTLDAWKASRANDGHRDACTPEMRAVKLRRALADAARAEAEAEIAAAMLKRIEAVSVSRASVDALLAYIATRQRAAVETLGAELLARLRALPPEEWAAEWRTKEADLYEQMQKIVADWTPPET